MDDFRELADKLKAFNRNEGCIFQGIVKTVDGFMCSVQIGNIEIPSVRLRASETDDDSQMLVVPKIDSAVIVGSLSGDLSELVVLQVDKVERIEINGGSLGGLIKINELTEKLNDLVNKFNSHTHVVNTTGTAAAQSGTSLAPGSPAQTFRSKDYEDDKITH